MDLLHLTLKLLFQHYLRTLASYIIQVGFNLLQVDNT